jgi:hypothetical protein
LIGNWFDRVDPGTHRRIKGLRLVTAFALAAMPEISARHTTSLGALAAGFALWASVSEAVKIPCYPLRIPVLRKNFPDSLLWEFAEKCQRHSGFLL